MMGMDSPPSRQVQSVAQGIRHERLPRCYELGRHEFADADLGDERRTHAWSNSPMRLASIPLPHCRKPVAAGACSKPPIASFITTTSPPKTLLQSHVEATYSRLEPAPVVLAVQDTTEANWTKAPGHPRVGASGPYRMSRAVGPYHLSHHTRAGALGALGATGLGPGPGRRGQTRPAQAAPHQPEGKSEVAPQSRRRVHRP